MKTTLFCVAILVLWAIFLAYPEPFPATVSIVPLGLILWTRLLYVSAI